MTISGLTIAGLLFSLAGPGLTGPLPDGAKPSPPAELTMSSGEGTERGPLTLAPTPPGVCCGPPPTGGSLSSSPPDDQRACFSFPWIGKITGAQVVPRALCGVPEGPLARWLYRGMLAAKAGAFFSHFFLLVGAVCDGLIVCQRLMKCCWGCVDNCGFQCLFRNSLQISFSSAPCMKLLLGLGYHYCDCGKGTL